jgi:CRP-like cAMP-binding protein
VSTTPPFLGRFDDDDARWLNDAGERRSVRAGETVIEEGVMPAHLFVVLGGEFVVSSRSLRDPEMQRVGAGEVLGEMSYLNDLPPAASVYAAADGLLLCIPRDALARKVAADPGFGLRFQTVMSSFAVDRFWTYGRRGRPDLLAEGRRDDRDASLRVHELIEKLLRGEL